MFIKNYDLAVRRRHLEAIVESFTDALLRTLRVDFVYARLPAAGDSGSLIEAVSLDPRASDLSPSDIAAGLRSFRSSEGFAFPPPISSTGAAVGLASIGLPGPAAGVVVAGMRRDDFPSRVGQEALNNIAKHAGARAVVITLEASTGELVLRVRDDGRGFDAGKSFPGHLGLRSMRERAASVGGVVVISSAPGQGTEVTIRVPRRETA